jgi:hypothetical protein
VLDTNADIGELEEQLRQTERRLDRLRGAAERRVEDYQTTRAAAQKASAFLETAPAASELLDQLTSKLFGEILDEIKINLTNAVREILGQERTIEVTHALHGGKLHIAFQVESPDGAEDILTGQGGSVCNILSVGLRLIALSRLDQARHRPFLVLDEQDCWLRPDLVPKFMKLIAKIAERLGIQVLVVSHHPVDLFAAHATRIYGFKPSRELGVVAELLRDASPPSEGVDPSGAAPE